MIETTGTSNHRLTSDGRPACDHGPMRYVEFEGQRGFVCVLPKGERDRCESVMLPSQPETPDLPFAEAPVEPAAVVPEPRKPVETPKPQPAQPKASEKPSEPVETTEGATRVEPNGPFGLQARREWLKAVRMAFKAQHRLVNVAAQLVMMASTDREVWSSPEHLSEETGIQVRHIKTERSRLVAEGFMVDTGKRKGRATVYRLAQG